MKPTRLAVTGASGYLGGRVVAAAALDSRFAVRAVSTTSVPWLHAETLQVRALTSDAGEAVAGADAVVHLAGANEVAALKDPEGSIASTVAAGAAVAKACASGGVKTLVFVSTIHVYGSSLTPGATITEETPPAPRHPYAVARLECERALAVEAPDVDLVVIRLANSVGAPPAPSVDRWTLVGNDLCRQAVCGPTIRLKNPGQHRDFIPIADVVRALLAAAEGTVPAGVYNLSSGRSVTVRALAEDVARLCAEMGLGRKSIEASPGGEEVPYTIRSDRLRSTGWCPSMPLDDALRETLEFCTRHRSVLCGS